MAKLKVTGLNKVRTNIRKRMIRTLRAKEVRQSVAKIIVNDIKTSDYGRPSDGYYEWRRMNDGLNKTDPYYSRDKINITFTGDLLKDLIRNVKASFTNGVQFVLEHSEKPHKAYRTQSGKTKKVSFDKISKGIRRYYDYLKVSDKAEKKVIKFVRDHIRRNLK